MRWKWFSTKRKRTRKTELEKDTTFSKRAVKWTLIVAMFDLQLSYVLALLGREEIAEKLSITIVTEIVAVVIGYLVKSFFETREEKSLEFKKEKANNSSLAQGERLNNSENEVEKKKYIDELLLTQPSQNDDCAG